MTKFGVSFVDSEARHRELVERIEEPLEYGDRRSPRIRNLIGMGLAAEDVFDDLRFEFDGESEAEIAEAREEYLREALRVGIKAMAEGEDRERQTSSA